MAIDATLKERLDQIEALIKQAEVILRKEVAGKVDTKVIQSSSGLQFGFRCHSALRRSAFPCSP